MDTWHHRPKLFRNGSDLDRDGDHESIGHFNRDRDPDANSVRNRDGDCDRRCYRNRNCDSDRDCDANRDCDRRRCDGDGDARGRLYGGGIFDAGGKRGQSVRAQHRQ